jgi:hypothetical protein
MRARFAANAERDGGGSPNHRCASVLVSLACRRLTLSQGFGFALIAAGAFFVFHKW